MGAVLGVTGDLEGTVIWEKEVRSKREGRQRAENTQDFTFLLSAYRARKMGA